MDNEEFVTVIQDLNETELKVAKAVWEENKEIWAGSGWKLKADEMEEDEFDVVDEDDEGDEE